jgi:hypothetical protein
LRRTTAVATLPIPSVILIILVGSNSGSVTTVLESIFGERARDFPA